MNNRGFGKTPVSNTGVKRTNASIEVGIGWVSGTAHESVRADLMGHLRSIFKDEFIESRGVGFYQRSFRSLKGILIGISPYQASEVQREDFYLSLSASILSELPQSSIKSLFTLLNSYEFHYSRIDIELDDYQKRITPQLAYGVYQMGGVSGFRRHRWLSSGSAPGTAGDTLELGRRGKSGGGKFLRIYDKFAESGGVIDCTRCELELSGERCRSVAEILSVLDIEDWAEAIRTIFASSIDFVTRVDCGRLDRSARVSWWDSIISGAGKIRLSSPKVLVNSIVAMQSWVKKQVAPTIATLFNALGEDWEAFLWDCVFDGEKRMSERHQAALSIFARRNEVVCATG